MRVKEIDWFKGVVAKDAPDMTLGFYHELKS